MAYPTGTLGKVLDSIDTEMIALKTRAMQVNAAMAANDVGAGTVLGTYISLRNTRARLVSSTATPGLAEYARAEKNNAGLDVVAEFNAVIAAIDDITTWVSANFPKDGNGYILAQTLGPDGPVERMFSPAATAGMRTLLTTLINAIN